MAKRRLSKDEWRQRIAEWRASGRSREDYCAEQGLHPRTMEWWERILAKGGPRASAASKTRARFVEVTAAVTRAPAEARLELQVGAVIVRVPPVFDADMLGRVLSVLEARR
jgi:hypothetical protein